MGEYPGEQALRACFDDFDEDGDGMCETEQLREMLIALKLPFTNERFDEVSSVWDPETKPEFTFEEFCEVAKLDDQEMKRTVLLRDSLALFDNEGLGFVDMASLMTILANFGDKMSEEDLMELAQHMPVDSLGRLDIDTACAMLLAGEEEEEIEEKSSSKSSSDKSSSNHLRRTSSQLPSKSQRRSVRLRRTAEGQNRPHRHQV